MHPDDTVLCRCRLPAKKTDFQPHDFDSEQDEDLLFYHVYDAQSQTPFVEDIGILAGSTAAAIGSVAQQHHRQRHHCSIASIAASYASSSSSTPTASQSRKKQPFKHRITPAAITQHLDPANRTPTPFISLYDDEELAWREAQRRLHAPLVWDARIHRWQPRGEVMVAVLGARQMSEAGVFYFSAAQLVGAGMLALRASSLLRRRVGGAGEWFAMDWIPCSAMEGFIEPQRED